MLFFGDILDAVLEANLKHQLSCERIKNGFAPHFWLKENCTIALSYGRQTGKTTAIARRATSADLVVFHYTNLGFKDKTFWNPTLASIRTLEKMKDKRFDRVWVDNASYMEKADIDNVYVTALMSGAKQVILIG